MNSLFLQKLFVFFEMRQLNTNVTISARYFTIGADQPKRIILACHGYGQLAQYFIKKFESLLDEDTMVIAPEGLSKFYLEGFSGRVGASWMTKEDRESDIESHTNFLQTIYEQYAQQFPKANWVIFGFSQGAPTVCRWLHKYKPKTCQIILWAGIIPPELNNDFKPESKYFDHQDITICYGNQDNLITEEHHKKIKELQKEVPQINIVAYEGAHEIIPETLVTLVK